MCAVSRVIPFGRCLIENIGLARKVKSILTSEMMSKSVDGNISRRSALMKSMPCMSVSIRDISRLSGIFKCTFEPILKE